MIEAVPQLTSLAWVRLTRNYPAPTKHLPHTWHSHSLNIQPLRNKLLPVSSLYTCKNWRMGSLSHLYRMWQSPDLVPGGQRAELAHESWCHVALGQVLPNSFCSPVLSNYNKIPGTMNYRKKKNFFELSISMVPKVQKLLIWLLWATQDDGSVWTREQRQIQKASTPQTHVGHIAMTEGPPLSSSFQSPTTSYWPANQGWRGQSAS